MSGQRWYAVPRSYRVRDEVYVLAASAAAARESAEDHLYAEQSGQEPASVTRYGRARLVSDDLAETLSHDHGVEPGIGIEREGR